MQPCTAYTRCTPSTATFCASSTLTAAGCVYSQVAVMRRQDVDALPKQTNANRLRVKLRSLPPVRIESRAAD